MTAMTPEEVFRSAQDAMARGDYEAFFQCIDRNDLARIVDNSMKLFLNLRTGPQMDEFKALCARHGILAEQIDHIVQQGERIMESAHAMTTVRDFRALTPDQAQAFMERSRKHRDLVKEYDVLLKSALKSAGNLALLTAGLERMQRARSDSGSVSTRIVHRRDAEGCCRDGKGRMGSARGQGLVRRCCLCAARQAMVHPVVRVKTRHSFTKAVKGECHAGD
jgi:hypothetical protein